MGRKPILSPLATALHHPLADTVEFTFNTDPLPRYVISVSDFRAMQRAFRALGLMRHQPPVRTHCAWCKQPMIVPAAEYRSRLRQSRTGSGLCCSARCSGRLYSWWSGQQKEKDPTWIPPQNRWERKRKGAATS